MNQATGNTGVAAEPFEKGGKLSTRGGTLGALLADFRDYLRVLKRSPATIDSALQALKPFFAFLDVRGLDMRAVAVRDLEAYRLAMRETGRYTEHSLSTYLYAVRRFYGWLERTGRVLLNPAAGLLLPRVVDALPRTVLSASEIRRLLDAPDTSTPLGLRDRTLLEVFYSTGLRLAELCALTVHDVDTGAGYVRVNAGKGSKDRVVPLGRKACDALKDYLRHVRGRLTKNRRDERALFVGKHGRKIHHQIVERLVLDYARAAGIRKRITPHALRHTCATHLLQGGADVSHVQRLLGHVGLGSTQLYTRVAGREVKATHAKTHPREFDAT